MHASIRNSPHTVIANTVATNHAESVDMIPASNK